MRREAAAIKAVPRPWPWRAGFTPPPGGKSPRPSRGTSRSSRPERRKGGEKSTRSRRPLRLHARLVVVDLRAEVVAAELLGPFRLAVADAEAIDLVDLHRPHDLAELGVGLRLARDVAAREIALFEPVQQAGRLGLPDAAGETAALRDIEVARDVGGMGLGAHSAAGR